MKDTLVESLEGFPHEDVSQIVDDWFVHMDVVRASAARMAMLAKSDSPISTTVCQG
jgi:hypothetical protein